jgi:hypothetical protein
VESLAGWCGPSINRSTFGADCLRFAFSKIAQVRRADESRIARPRDGAGGGVTAALILVLLFVCGLLVLKLIGAHKDNADLRARNRSLKRQLVRMS